MKEPDLDYDFDDYDYMGNSASSMDCTGLIPSGPVTEEDFPAYEALYKFEPPKVEIKDEPPENFS